MKVKPNKYKTLIRIINQTKAYYLSLFLGLILTLFFALNRQVLIIFLGNIVDSAMTGSFELKAGKLLLFVSLIVSTALFAGFRNYAIGVYSKKSLYSIRKKTIEQAEQYSLAYISGLSTGAFISGMNNSLREIEKFLEHTIIITANNILVGIGAIIVGIFINPLMTIFLITITSLLTFLARRIAKSIKDRKKELLTINSQIGGIAQDAINGHLEIKSFNLYKNFLDKLNENIDKGIKISLKIVKSEMISEGTLLTVSFSLQVIIVIFGLYFVDKGDMTLGNIVIFQQILDSIKRIWRIDFISFNKTIGATDHLFELWGISKETDNGTVTKGKFDEPLILLKDVSFKYYKDEEYSVMDKLNLCIQKGETIAIAGKSGCGKSTLLKLLAGFYEVDSGEIYYRGYKYDEWEKEELRKDFSLVEQSPYLFPASIYENIACGAIGNNPEGCLDEKIKKAAEYAEILPFVSQLDNQFETIIGERGVTLSGGQRQRIAIARAFLKNGEILILDEPSSALDAGTESKIDQSLKALMKGKTTIIVSHRFSTIKKADRILVMDKGRIVEEGTDRELMDKKGLYFRLYRKQLLNSRGAQYETE